jgi:preprotein translocase subunit YajC
MEFFIQNAWAQNGPTPPGFGDLLVIAGALIFIYFTVFRPQQKKTKEQKKMVEALAKGDEIITTGGLLGRIVDLGDNFLLLEIGKGVQVKVQRGAVSMVVPKGTGKSL